jgi:glycolate oxidase iron-sulfur subunit
MDRLFAHIHGATQRTLEANGYRVLSARLPQCCGALHAHAGEVVSARSLAKANLDAMVPDADFIVVNSAGCGAMLKDYGHLVGGESARAFSARVRDVAELLAAAGPRAGAPLDLRVAYDAPCHLQHAQRVHSEVLRVLDAVPKMVTTLLPDSDQCCGSAGIFSLVQPGMSQAVLARKIENIAGALPRPDIVTTGNPGCLMQIGAGLLAAGLDIPVAHPVELLDWSYEKAGFYDLDGGVSASLKGSSSPRALS